jgi:hypothetical protein
MFWSQDWVWSLPLIVLTTVIHVIVLSYAALKGIEILRPSGHDNASLLKFCIVIGAITFLATLLLAVESALWAVAYHGVGAMPDYESAVLYSLGAITSYGHADVYLEHRWRLMGTLEALNGIILFGLTTAFFFSVVQAVRPLDRRRVSGGH